MASPNGPVVFLLGAGTTFTDFQHVADLYGWRVVEELRGDSGRMAHEQIRVTRDGTTAIHYLDDPTPEARFLVVRGPQTGAVAFNVGRHFESETSDEVLERVRSAVSDDEKVDAAYKLAVVFMDYDEEVMGLMRTFYEGGSGKVRYAAINALGYRGWPEARAFLERAAQEDPDPKLRKNAQAIVNVRWEGATNPHPR